jgi:divalent metal cation (Fe/Co/Zn/Cd) transporter
VNCPVAGAARGWKSAARRLKRRGEFAAPGKAGRELMSPSIKLGWGTLVVSIVVLALKAYAYVLTNSLALYSDALETVINVVSAAAALFALWFAEQPADANHPYGHQKAEYVSAVVEGALILATAFWWP